MTAASLTPGSGAGAGSSDHVRSTTRSALRAGGRDMVPMAIGVAPFGLAIGAAVGSSDLPAVVGWLSGPAILAGAAQLSTVEMLDGGAAPLVIVVSALVINARILMYSAAMAPWFRDEPLGRRLLLAVPLIDQMYLTAAPRFEEGDLDAAGRRTYWLGGAAVLCTTWIGAQTAAMVVGAGMPAGAHLDMAAPLALAGLLAKSITGRPAVVAATVAGTVAVVGAGLPFQASVLVAALAGVVAGARAEGASS